MKLLILHLRLWRVRVLHWLLLSAVGSWLLETSGMTNRENYPTTARTFWRGYHIGFSVGVLAAVITAVVVAFLK